MAGYMAIAAARLLSILPSSEKPKTKQYLKQVLNPHCMLQLAGLKCFLSFLFFSLKIAIHAPSL